MLKASDIKKLCQGLPSLAFEIEQDEKNTRLPLVQAYLDHYKINFSQSVAGVRHGFGTFPAAGFTIAAHYWLPEMPRGTIFVVHGYFDHVGLYNHLIRFSLQNEYAVVAFDLPGMGLSSGERATINSFEDYHHVLEACLEQFKPLVPQPWYAVAQSAGSTAVIQHLNAASQSPLKKAVLLAPLIRSKGWQRDRWLYNLGRWFVGSLPRIFTDNSHDQAFLTFLRKQDPLQYRRLPITWVGAMKHWIRKVKKFDSNSFPLLIIQGDDDQTVDWQYNLTVYKELFPKAVVKMIPKARHHLVAESAPYRAQVFAAIKSYLEKS